MSAAGGNETLLPTSWQARPRGFAALMALYESNYLRLARLAGDPARLDGERLSRVAAGCDLRLTVLERCRYTTTVGLTHLFQDPAAVGPALDTFLTYPDVRIRIYRDARMAQAQHWPADRPEPYGRHPGEAGRELEQRWLFNNMLNKWLEYCLDLGHSLVP
ncbi:MAG TPA: DUF1249 domain-containing protein [Steroidobacteraceae bacterium]|nr:DUF1249 domain-containing protein [Steroidobacteraceae bacterium]